MLVDAVYGIGFHGRLPDALRPVFRLANQSDAPVIALDVPSGFSADSGVYDEDTIRAEYTVTFTAMKPGLLVHGASELTGPVEVAQIGIDPALLDQYAPSQTIVDWEMVRACFLPRPLDLSLIHIYRPPSGWTGTPDHGGLLSLILHPPSPPGPPLLLTKGGNTSCFPPFVAYKECFRDTCP